MDSITVDGRELAITRATEADVPALAALLADDELGAQRESDDLAPYVFAFQEIDKDDNQFLVAARDEGGTVVATMQLTVIPVLSRGGAKRLQIEAVRVSAVLRGSGLGSALIRWAHAYGQQRGATLAQLTSDKSRVDAHRFYAALRYEASHEGFKRALWPPL
ncbi:GNAT family N-acetyltransferase [Nocardioides sp. Kera G14]|uniref:GNAT family N-acetyltransferase n=1 Tax=Nocardioides sp. Kera G14 TaxID=2884264 RepID=UPI001D12723E|nr:GNAT family N-acetyltransferase [Nocardioides sp. Kera G14]UDY23359.1 GNAT family N-acetyltransferase [Nocardioides sp. Kera G14]